MSWPPQFIPPSSSGQRLTPSGAQPATSGARSAPSGPGPAASWKTKRREEPGSGSSRRSRYRFMGRRRLDRTDRNGDPLDGVVNLFDVAIVLAVAFLLAALSGIGLSDILAGKDMTVVKNPGQTDMQVIVRQGDQITKLDLKPGEEVSGVGTLIGQFYQLDDGTTVYVPVGSDAGAAGSEDESGSQTSPSTPSVTTPVTPGNTSNTTRITGTSTVPTSPTDTTN